MSFVSRFNPKTGAADLWSEFRKPNPYRWPILAVSVIPFATVLYWASTETVYKDPERPQITYITTFDPARSDAEIAASNAANQEFKELRSAAIEEAANRKREVYKALGKGMGMDVDKIAAEADAERAAKEAAKAKRLAEIFGETGKAEAESAPSSPVPTPAPPRGER